MGGKTRVYQKRKLDLVNLCKGGDLRAAGRDVADKEDAMAR
jgi:hypothetical protein